MRATGVSDIRLRCITALTNMLRCVTGTARMRSRVYETVRCLSVRLSVCLSVLAWAADSSKTYCCRFAVVSSNRRTLYVQAASQCPASSDPNV